MRQSGQQTTIEVPRAVRSLLERIGRIAEAQGVAVYAVGGCVRDWALRVPRAADLDVTVEGDSLHLARRVAEALEGTVRVHEQFGTATVELGRRRVDVAMCRKETYAHHAAYPRVSPGTVQEDLARRDFTINAMAMAIAPSRFGEVVDPFGGREDLRRRLLRVLHAGSFLDDPSRILRGIRFAQRFQLRWEAATAQALHEAMAAGALGWLNAGRLRKELELMLREPGPVACLRQLHQVLSSSEPDGHRRVAA